MNSCPIAAASDDPNTPYVYRLENDWRNRWEHYFGNNLQYTCFRGIDELEKHDIQIPLASCEDLCGLWIFTDFSDAIKFQLRNPIILDLGDPVDIENSPHNSINYLRKTRDNLNGIARLAVRIHARYFENETLHQDKPLINAYNSSRFHVKKYNTKGNNLFKGTLSSDKVPSVFVPDEFVDVYFDGAWWRKSARLKEYILGHIGRCGHVRDIILSPTAESAPLAELPPPPIEMPATAPPASTAPTIRELLWGFLGRRSAHR